MDTTVVAQSAIGALAALIGGLGGASIAVRNQRLNERSRQRERAAEVLGSVGPLLTELHPGGVLMRVYLAELFEIGQQDPVDEALAKLAKLDKRVPLVRAELSALAAWWPTSKGSDLAEQLQTAIYQVRNVDQSLVEDFQIKKDASDAVNRAVEAAVEAGDDPNVQKRAFEVWEKADTVASQLRAEIRGTLRHRR